MGLFDNVLDWAADKVQSFTGEKERRQLVLQVKEIYTQFKTNAEMAVDKLNDAIEVFNSKIQLLNSERQGIVKNNISSLFSFLSKFGKLKDVGQYCKENEKIPANLPEHQYESIGNYIRNIDWTKDDVFQDSFLLSPIGMKVKTRKQNLSMHEKISELQLEAEETINQIRLRTFSVGVEQEICELYIQNIIFISNFIKEKIIPELAMVESFFQALKIKDKVIAGHELVNLEFRNEIQLLKDTIYKKHYYFIKNAFVFFIFSCKVYNTPVLTNLLNNVASEDDRTVLLNYRKELTVLSSNVEENIMK